MTLAISAPSRASEDHLLLESVSWEFYEMFLREIGDSTLRVTYDQGRMEIMSPLPEHEYVKTSLGRMIGVIALELNVPMYSLGSTTFKLKKLKRGFEPDECYYIKHEAEMRGKKKIDLRKDPPPDLIVEIDITHRDIEREGLYAAFGVPELWRFDGKRVWLLRLGEDRQFHVAETSAAFPFVRSGDLEPFLAMVEYKGETAALRAFRDWVLTAGGAK